MTFVDFYMGWYFLTGFFVMVFFVDHAKKEMEAAIDARMARITLYLFVIWVAWPVAIYEWVGAKK